MDVNACKGLLARIKDDRGFHHWKLLHSRSPRARGSMTTPEIGPLQIAIPLAGLASLALTAPATTGASATDGAPETTQLETRVEGLPTPRSLETPPTSEATGRGHLEAHGWAQKRADLFVCS